MEWRDLDVFISKNTVFKKLFGIIDVLFSQVLLDVLFKIVELCGVVFSFQQLVDFLHGSESTTATTRPIHEAEAKDLEAHLVSNFLEVVVKRWLHVHSSVPRVAPFKQGEHKTKQACYAVGRSFGEKNMTCFWKFKSMLACKSLERFRHVDQILLILDRYHDGRDVLAQITLDELICNSHN